MESSQRVLTSGPESVLWLQEPRSHLLGRGGTPFPPAPPSGLFLVLEPQVEGGRGWVMGGGGPWGLAGKGLSATASTAAGDSAPLGANRARGAPLGQNVVFLGPPKGRMSLKSYIILDYADE